MGLLSESGGQWVVSKERFPPSRDEFTDPASRMFADALQDVDQVGVGVHAVQLAGDEQALDDSHPSGAHFGGARRMKLGYARVSTTDQDLAIQRGRLHEAGCEKLFEEKTSGARKKRPELERLLSEMRTDDVLVITRLDRLARSTSELLRIAETIEGKNAGLQSIAEPWADTTTPAGRMVLTVFAGIAEFERSLIATRTEEGRRAAQARGVPFGRPPKLRPEQRTLARQLIDEGKSIRDVARTFNVHVATIYRCLHDEPTL